MGRSVEGLVGEVAWVSGGFGGERGEETEGRGEDGVRPVCWVRVEMASSTCL